MRTLTRPGKGVALLAVLLIVVVGALVSTVRDDGGEPAGYSSGAEGDFDGGSGSAAAGASAGSGGGTIAGPEGGRDAALTADPAARIIKTASVRVKVGDGKLDDIEKRMTAAVADAAGFIHESRQDEDSLTLTVRVPAARFDAVLREIRRQGEVKDQSVEGRDVTEEYVDLNARLRHWRAQEAVYLRLLSNAGTIPESLEVQRELSRVQETIEQLEGRRRYLDDQTALSTITIRFVTPAAAGNSQTEGRLAESWDNATDAAFNVMDGTFVVVGGLIPLAIMVGIPTLIAWTIFHRRRPAASG